MAKKLNKKIPNSFLFVLTNAGHFSYLDNSGSFLKILSAFIYGNAVDNNNAVHDDT